MRHFVIASDPIQTRQAHGYLHKNKIADVVKYTSVDMRRYFSENRDMLVFNSLEEAKLYSLLYRDYNQKNNYPIANWGYQQHPVYLVCFPDEFNLTKFKTVHELADASAMPPHIATYEGMLEKTLDRRGYKKPRYYRVPPEHMIQVVAAYDSEGVEYDLSDIFLEHQDTPKRSGCVIL